MKRILEAAEHDQNLSDEEETVNELTYLGDRVNAGGKHKAALTARKRCGLAMFCESLFTRACH